MFQFDSPKKRTAPTDVDGVLEGLLPLVWAHQFEQANMAHQPGIALLSDVWRQLNARSRQRGTAKLSDAQWPGSVFLPAWVIKGHMKSDVLSAPAAWGLDCPEASARVVALVAGWRQDRLVYEFDEVPALLVKTASVDVALSPTLFAGLPAHSVFVDFHRAQSLIDDEDCPRGFLAGLNFAEGSPEMVLVSELSGQINVDTIPLDGSTLDCHCATLVHTDPAAHARVSIMVSALLMVMIAADTVDEVEDVLDGSATLSSYTRLCVTKAFNPAIAELFDTISLRSDVFEECVVASWAPSTEEAQGYILNCLVGASFDWREMAGKTTGIVLSPAAVLEESSVLASASGAQSSSCSPIAMPVAPCVYAKPSSAVTGFDTAALVLVPQHLAILPETVKGAACHKSVMFRKSLLQDSELARATPELAPLRAPQFLVRSPN